MKNSNALAIGALVVLASKIGASHYIPVGLDFLGVYRKTIWSNEYSTVLLLENNSTSELRTVKIFPRNIYKETMPDDVYAHEIITEFEIARSLHPHPNIIATESILEHDGKYHMVMEYVPFSLRDWIMDMDGTPSAEEVACVFRQLLEGVSHMHATGIAHLDMKLPNAMIDKDSRVKLIDFGTAVRFGLGDTDLKDVSGSKGDSGRAKVAGPRGTPPFLPPEVFVNTSYDARKVDIWALALMYCQMFKPYLPWRQATEDDVDSFYIFDSQDGLNEAFILQDVALNRDTLRSLAGLMPGDAIQILTRMLEPDPRQRAGWGEIWSDEWVQTIACPFD